LDKPGMDRTSNTIMVKAPSFSVRLPVSLSRHGPARRLRHPGRQLLAAITDWRRARVRPSLSVSVRDTPGPAPVPLRALLFISGVCPSSPSVTLTSQPLSVSVSPPPTSPSHLSDGQSGHSQLARRRPDQAGRPDARLLRDAADGGPHTPAAQQPHRRGDTDRGRAGPLAGRDSTCDTRECWHVHGPCQSACQPPCALADPA
jgi:hypothetical protein